MRKIENFKDIYGKELTWADIEAFYIAKIVSISKTKKGYKAKLQLLIDKENDFKKKLVLRYLLIHITQIIIAKPAQLQSIINNFKIKELDKHIYDYNRKDLTEFGKALRKVFNYNYLRRTKLVELAGILNTKTCLYCNSQYALTITKGKKKKALFQFDHFFPSSIFPYLSLSLYNLIPCCSNCNNQKSNKEVNITEFAHPFIENFHELCEFTFDIKEQIKILCGVRVEEDEINIELMSSEKKKAGIHNKLFLLEDIYDKHKDVALEVFRKAHVYNNGGKEALLALKSEGKNDERLFNSESEIIHLLLGNYPNEEDINKRPLSKFMIDMGKQSGLIQ